MSGPLAEALAAIIAGGLLLIIGVGVLTGRQLPGEFWGLAGTVFGWWGRGQAGRQRRRRGPEEK